MLTSLAVISVMLGGHQQVPVSVRLSDGGQYTRGQAVQVEVKAEEDGHLLVLQASPSGLVRVLFPLDPGDDSFVKGGRSYQLRDRSDRTDVFKVDERSGTGIVLVALSKGPLSVDGASENGHWDYKKLVISDKDELDAGLAKLAQSIAGPDVRYDVAGYDVIDPAYANRDAGAYRGARLAPYGSWAGYYGWGYSPFYWDPYYAYGYGYPYYGYGYGFGLGFGYYGYGYPRGYWGGYPVIIGGGGYTPRPGNSQPYGGRFGNRNFGNRTFNSQVSPYRQGFSAAPRASFGGVVRSFGGSFSHGSGGRSFGGGGGGGGGGRHR